MTEAVSEEEDLPKSQHELLMQRFAEAPERINGVKALEEGDRPGHWLVLTQGATEPQLFVAGAAGIDALLDEFFNPDPERELAGSRSAAISVVNKSCETARLRVAPYINYMDTEYQVLAAQADAYVLAGRPEDPVGLAMLVQSAEDSGKTISDEADAIRTKRDAYIALLNATRSLRRQAAAAIEAADTAEAIANLRDQYVAQLASL